MLQTNLLGRELCGSQPRPLVAEDIGGDLRLDLNEELTGLLHESPLLHESFGGLGRQSTASFVMWRELRKFCSAGGSFYLPNHEEQCHASD